MAYTLSGLVVTDFISGAGIDTRRPVRAATTVAGTLASSFANASVIDGVTLATGDRILIKNQAAAAQNGIYVVQSTGAPLRADDLLDGMNAGGVKVSVRSGTANAGTVWICTSASDLVGTDSLTWTQQGQVTFTGAESVSNKTITASTVDNSAIGATTASTGRFTTVAATSTTNQMVMGTTNTTTLSFPAPGASMTLTFPNIADTIVGRTTTDTLTNKTLTSPAINGGTINNASVGATTASTGRFTSVAITNASAQIALGTTNVLTLTSAQSGTASLTIPDLAGVNGTLATLSLTQTFTGSKTFAAGVTFSSASNQIVLGTTNTLTITSNQSSTAVLTLPNLGGVADTVAVLALAQTMTNKTLTSTTNTIAAKQLLSATTAIDVFSATAPTAGQVLTATSGTAATWQSPSGGGISTLNTLTATTQTFAVGTTGSDFNIASSGSTHTFNMPDADASTRGVVNTGSQTIGGSKTFSSGVTITSGSNQIVLSNGGNGVTISSPTQGGNGTVTIPNLSGVSYTLVLENLTQTILNKNLVSGITAYTTGTISQSGTTITGVGTTFTAAMIGGVIKYPDSTSASITGFTNSTTLTAIPSQTVASTTYTIYYGSGYAMSNAFGGAGYISNLFTDSLRILNSSDRTENIQFTFEAGMTTGTSLQLSANQTGNGKLIFPNTVAATSTLVATDIQQTLTNKFLGDSTTRIVNVADTTRGINFSVTGTTGTILTLASGQTTSKTLTIPDILRTGDRFVTEQTEQMLFRKTMTNGKDGNAATLYTATTTLSIGSLSNGGVWSIDGRYNYSVRPNANLLSIYDTQTGTLTTAATGTGPVGLELLRDGSNLYVSNVTSNTVTKHNSITGVLITTIAVGTAPRRGVAASTNNYLYIPCSTANSVSVIDTSTDTVAFTLTTGITSPITVALTYDDSLLFIGGGSTLAWYTAPNTFGGTISTGTILRLVADVYRDRLYAATSAGLQIVDTVSKTIVSSVSGMGNMNDISVSPGGDYIYGVGSASGVTQIYDINAGTFSTIFTVGEASNSLRVDPFGWKLAVYSASNVRIYDIRTTRYAKYAIGRASQSGETITGVGTRWWQALDGGTIVYANGTTADISIASVSEVSGTAIASTYSQTVTSQAYTIYHSGSILNPAGGMVLKNGLIAADPVFTSATDDSRRLSFGMGNLTPGATVNIYPYATSNLDIAIPNSAGAEEFVLLFATQAMSNKSFYDNTFRIINSIDDTKRIAFSAGGNSTGVTLTLASTQTTSQTVNFPNTAGADTVVLVSLAQTLANKNLSDTTSYFVSAGDNSKRVTFSVAGNTTGVTLTLASSQTTSQTINIPNVTTTDTFLTAALTQTLTNKNLSDTTTKIVNVTDATKRIGFNLAGNTTGVTLTLTTAQTTSQIINIPNITATDTIVVTNLAQTLLAKTLTDPIISEDAGPPAAPASGAKLFTLSVANDQRLAMMPASGVETDIQASFYSKIVSVCCPTPNATAVNSIGPLTYAGTNLVLKGLGNTNYRDVIPRAGVTTTTTVGSFASLRGGTNLMFIRGNGAGTGIGGFFIKFVFGIELSSGTITGQANAFIGLYNSTSSPTTTHPRTAVNNQLCGLSVATGQNNLQFITKSNPANAFTEVDTGISVNSNNTTNRYVLTMFCRPEDTVLYWSLVVYPSGNTVLSSSASANLPATNTFMMPHVWAWNGTAAAAWGIQIHSIYAEVNTI